ncbi:MAG: ribonuclease HI [Thermodesulfobacteriota bacterium]|nr:ribonuclease HI [Thermodesulfobacteriota bacterium]
MAKTKKYYAVARGHRPGIYTAWFGPDGAEMQIRGFSGARYKGFASQEEAREWIKNPTITRTRSGVRSGTKTGDATVCYNHSSRSKPVASTVPSDTVVIYTDGSCRGNPGPGGYGAVIMDKGNRSEISEGYRLTTNNRMEMLACIKALKALKTPSDIILHSDSRYVVNGIVKGWAKKWRAKGWMRNKNDAAENADMWEQLLDACERHRVEFVWVKGHAGHDLNERCDELATSAADMTDLKEDYAYARGRTRKGQVSATDIFK